MGETLICLFSTSPPQESALVCGEQALDLGRCQETLGLSSSQLRAPAIVIDQDEEINEPENDGNPPHM